MDIINENRVRNWNWIAKDPPKYVWKGDVWYCERDKKLYIADIESSTWKGDAENSKTHPFTKGTVLMKEKVKRNGNT